MRFFFSMKAKKSSRKRRLIDELSLRAAHNVQKADIVV